MPTTRRPSGITVTAPSTYVVADQAPKTGRRRARTVPPVPAAPLGWLAAFYYSAATGAIRPTSPDATREPSSTAAACRRPTTRLNIGGTK